ncbi:hypothetical protein QFC20_007301 [Naganishia adeliensis]|uniref:Uncharacterized protein n=1 Tax=Naganishia adeliensis TaxID=92952 RepID=A0ACC2V188_9TREE|nr:hypothetical protein QFC20_007301 [Naganishia adeliensis]
MFMNTISACGLLACLARLSHGSPVARNNGGAKAITWISPDHQQFCWNVEKEGHEFASGQTLGVSACDNSAAQQFLCTTGATTIQLANTELCVEFGPGLRKNGRPLHVEKCRAKGAPGQRLFITEDNHIALENGPGQCADVKDGDVADGVGKLQSWRCASDNVNQIFFGKLPSVIAKTIRPFVEQALCLGALVFPFDPEYPLIPEVLISFSFEPAYKRFLFPTNNSTVQFFAEEIGKLFTWSQVLVENPVDPPINVTDWLENPSLEQVLTVIPGQGTFEGLVRFGNEESGLCAQFVSSEPFIPDSGYDSLERCDESDARQYYLVEPIQEHRYAQRDCYRLS